MYKFIICVCVGVCLGVRGDSMERLKERGVGREREEKRETKR